MFCFSLAESKRIFVRKKRSRFSILSSRKMHSKKSFQKVNAFGIFTQRYINDYERANGQRFPGGYAAAFKDATVKAKWEALSAEDKDAWKQRAKCEKSRARVEFVQRLTATFIPSSGVGSTSENQDVDDFGDVPERDEQTNLEKRSTMSSNSPDGSVGDGPKSEATSSKGQRWLESRAVLGGPSKTGVDYAQGNQAHLSKALDPLVQKNRVNSDSVVSGNTHSASSENADFNERADLASPTPNMETEGAAPVPFAAAEDDVEVEQVGEENVEPPGEDLCMETLPNLTPGAVQLVDAEFDACESVEGDFENSIGADDDPPETVGEADEFAPTFEASAEVVITEPSQTYPTAALSIGGLGADNDAQPTTLVQQQPAYAYISAPPASQIQRDIPNPFDFVSPPISEPHQPIIVSGHAGIGWSQEFREFYNAQLQMPHNHRGLGRGLHLVPQFRGMNIALQRFLSD